MSKKQSPDSKSFHALPTESAAGLNAEAQNSKIASQQDNEFDESVSLAEILSTAQLNAFHLHSSHFVGQWNTLISTTNWEKGAIISAWQKSMRDSEIPAISFTDQRWCQLVGGATPQHVGRLRRTYGRFGHVYQEYSGLYWSHFYAALDWDDAEMWLEGAVQNNWSVSTMRMTRWETLGKIPNEKPRNRDIVVTELEEESQSLAISPRVSAAEREYIAGPIYEGPDFGDEAEERRPSRQREDQAASSDDSLPRSKIKLFETFTDLPDDIQGAVNQLKIAIIRHKSAEWQEISLAKTLDLLDALKALAKAPVD